MSGRLKGIRRGGVPVVLQGKLLGARRFTTFADTTSSRRGTFRARYRFRTPPRAGAPSCSARASAVPPYETGATRAVRVRVR